MNQNFSSQQLIKFCKKTELSDYGFSKAELYQKLDEVTDKINEGKFDFTFKPLKGYYLTEGLVEKLILRKLNDNLKRIYKDEQANRRIIVSQIKTLLEETCPMYILKTDIESFYESVERNRLLDKLKDDAMLSYHSLKLINKIFDNPIVSGKTGLPRGLNISSTLSEMYMRKFDKWVRRFDGVYYYARYVDDIIIFTNQKETAEKIKAEIDSNLEVGLRKKESKTDIYPIDTYLHRPIEFLGYKFTTKKKKKDKVVVISIADNKVKKIKTRLVLSFLDFIKNREFKLLENRIKFLTGNFSIKTNSEGNELKAGIYYNYFYLNDFKVLNDLNIFYHKLIRSKNKNFGIKLTALLTSSQKDILSQYSFSHGHKNKVYYNFRPELINQIKNCWA
jgi:hypothetical protein